MMSLGWVTLIHMTGVLIREKFGHRGRYSQREGDVKTEAGGSHVIGVMHLPAKGDRKGSLAPTTVWGEAWEGLPRNIRESTALMTP